LLTPYKLTEEETILIACEYKEECISSCRGYRYNLSTNQILPFIGLIFIISIDEFNCIKLFLPPI
jgi:hypothetical protein